MDMPYGDNAFNVALSFYLTGDLHSELSLHQLF